MYKFLDPTATNGARSRRDECYIACNPHCMEAASTAKSSRPSSAYCGTECHPGCSGHCVDNISSNFAKRPTRIDLLQYLAQIQHAR